jgi:hypothetical protein|tara:strand:- start:1412 stop:1591 length:180 start_codon:yes stop_codon:yes gene_type:complete
MDSLEKLKNEHAKLHTAIEKELDQNPVDESKLSAMKKHKLWLKDKISDFEKDQKITNTL